MQKMVLVGFEQKLKDGFGSFFARFRALILLQSSIKQRFSRRDDITYTELVEYVLSDANLMRIMQGTNQHAIDNGEDIKLDGEAGLQELKVFLSLVFTKGMNKCPLKQMWKMDKTKGVPWARFMSLRRFRKIKEHFCFNPYYDSDKDVDPFYKFTAGLGKIRQKSLKLINDPHVFALDELGVVATSSKDPYKTFNPHKPIRKRRETFTCSVATQNHHGFIHSTLAYCGKKTYLNEFRVDENEKKMDNIVHLLIHDIHCYVV